MTCSIRRYAENDDERTHARGVRPPFAEYVNAGDLDALMALYEPDCSYARTDGSVARGHAAVREIMERLFAMRPLIRIEVTKAVQTGSLTAKQPDGTAIERSGKALEVVRRQPDGAWTFAIDDPFGRG